MAGHFVAAKTFKGGIPPARPVKCALAQSPGDVLSQWASPSITYIREKGTGQTMNSKVVTKNGNPGSTNTRKTDPRDLGSPPSHPWRVDRDPIAPGPPSDQRF